MPVINISRFTNTVTITFDRISEALDCVTLFTAPTLPNTNDAPARFHIERGCCDGTDPVACHKAREEAERIEREETRAERRRLRENEYAGTEPTVCDDPWHRHARQPMGFCCPTCGFVA